MASKVFVDLRNEGLPHGGDLFVQQCIGLHALQHSHLHLHQAELVQPATVS